MSEWYYQQDGAEQGPITFDTLAEMAEEGGISRDTLVWKSGLPEWKPAGEVEGIFSSPPDVDSMTDSPTEEGNNSGMGTFGCIGHLASLCFFLWLSYQVGKSRMGPAGMIDNPSPGWSWFIIGGIVVTIISFVVNTLKSN